MTGDELGVVCAHGQLERVCPLCELTAERDALAELVKEMHDFIAQTAPPSTHWEGCEAEHPRCAVLLRARAAIGEKP